MLYCRLKVHAAAEGNTISAAIEEAVKAHLSSGEPDVEEPIEAVSQPPFVVIPRRGSQPLPPVIVVWYG